MPRQIEITESYINDDKNTLYKGDRVTVSADKAAQWIAAGWAKDPKTGEQNERKPGVVKINVESVSQKTKR